MRYFIWSYKDFADNECESIIAVDENGMVMGIPYDSANIDYQQYKKWIEAGNTAEVWEEHNAAE